MPQTITGYVTLDADPTRRLTFRTHRTPHGSTDIEVEYRHTGITESIHVTPGSELYLCITRLIDGLWADPTDEDARPRLVAIA